MTKKKVLFISAAMVCAAFFTTLIARAQSETCTMEVGGSGHCVSISMGGNVVGYWCDRGSGNVPCTSH
jgi:hypothetical protein